MSWDAIKKIMRENAAELIEEIEGVPAIIDKSNAPGWIYSSDSGRLYGANIKLARIPRAVVGINVETGDEIYFQLRHAKQNGFSDTMVRLSIDTGKPTKGWVFTKATDAKTRQRLREEYGVTKTIRNNVSY